VDPLIEVVAILSEAEQVPEGRRHVQAVLLPELILEALVDGTFLKRPQDRGLNPGSFGDVAHVVGAVQTDRL
jgi:hypothetical protein